MCDADNSGKCWRILKNVWFRVERGFGRPIANTHASITKTIENFLIFPDLQHATENVHFRRIREELNVNERFLLLVS